MRSQSTLPTYFLCFLISLSFSHSGSFSPPVSSNPIQGKNSISGIVFDENRRPIADVYIELQDEMYRALAQTKTNASGRYSFSGLPDGYYKVKALPYGTDYEEQTQDASIINVSAAPGSGATNLYLDFHLRRKRVKDNITTPPGTVFVQEVPEEAKRLYEQGLQALQEKKEREAFEKLKRAIEIFPNYYLALDRLATEYIMRGYYAAAFILFSKALEVNPRSFSSTLGLGLAQYNLKRMEDAIQSFRRATDLYSKSPDAYLWLGKAFLQIGRLDQAEQSLKKANELFQGKSAEVHWQLARIYNEQKRYHEAADELELFLKYQPDSRDAEKIKQVIKRLRQKSSATEGPSNQQ